MIEHERPTLAVPHVIDPEVDPESPSTFGDTALERGEPPFKRKVTPGTFEHKFVHAAGTGRRVLTIEGPEGPVLEMTFEPSTGSLRLAP